jgi:hypothetical protein
MREGNGGVEQRRSWSGELASGKRLVDLSGFIAEQGSPRAASWRAASGWLTCRGSSLNTEVCERRVGERQAARFRAISALNEDDSEAASWRAASGTFGAGLSPELASMVAEDLDLATKNTSPWLVSGT